MDKYPIITEMLKEESPKSIFEVGCADGVLLKDYAEKNNVVVGGLDMFDCGEAFLKNHPKGVFYHLNAFKHPWPIQEHYDIAITVGFFMLLTANPTKILEEMFRIADKIIIAEWHKENTLSEIEIITWAPVDETMFPIRVGRDYRHILEKMGRKPEIYKFNDKWIIKA